MNIHAIDSETLLGILFVGALIMGFVGYSLWKFIGLFTCAFGIHKDCILGRTEKDSLKLIQEIYTVCKRCKRINRNWGLDLDWDEEIKFSDLPPILQTECKSIYGKTN